ncbi:MAG: formyltransferase [Desulfobacca sp.]|uniref:formyltransferase n=1 Tax=Desulfobacca sp. TaxID=2067990 RepID=UPI0040492678
MRLIFFGYSNIGYVSLEVLTDLCRQFQDEIVAVVTHEDDPRERLWFKSVHELAAAHHLPVYTPADPNDPAFVELLRGLRPDFIFSCYYRLMLKQPLLALPTKGALNLHGSLLPRYRGRCPLNWVLIHGEPLTGLSLHYMEATPDSGDLVAQVQVPIDPDDTARTLSDKMTRAAGQLMRRIYPLLRADAAPRIRQDHSRATYFGGRTPEDGRIDWQQSAPQIYNLIRAVTHPFPGAFTTWQDKKIFLWSAKVDTQYSGPALAPGQVRRQGARLWIGTGEGVLAVLAAQLEGQPELSGEALAPALDFLNGQVLDREP